MLLIQYFMILKYALAQLTIIVTNNHINDLLFISLSFLVIAEFFHSEFSLDVFLVKHFNSDSIVSNLICFDCFSFSFFFIKNLIHVWLSTLFHICFGLFLGLKNEWCIVSSKAWYFFYKKCRHFLFMFNRMLPIAQKW